jgi:hypothetical protein
MLRPIAALTLVSMMIGTVLPFLRISRAMRRPSSGSSIITSRIRRSGLISSSFFIPSARLGAPTTS